MAPAHPWPATPAAQRTRPWNVVTALAVIALLLGLQVVSLQHRRLVVGSALPADSWSLDGRSYPLEEFPSPTTEEEVDPLGTPMAPPDSGGDHAFVYTQDDGVTPVAYDPCRPVHYVVRPDHEPAGGRSLIADAVDEISAITGLQFVFDGETTEDPRHPRPAYQPDRYGDRWAPVLISWATAAEVPDFAGAPIGLGISSAYGYDDTPYVYVSGTVELDAGYFADVLTRPGGRTTTRATLLHELGHLVGLDHVDDRSQLMYESERDDVTDFAAGDLAGLAQLGSGACVPDL